jgi:uncharacterized protein (TIGR02147 family)
MGALTQPSPYGYSDYRIFLRDLFSFYKKRNRRFTYRVFARQANISSSGFLKEVIDGKKNISTDTALRFAEGFKLGKRETEYFVNLAMFTQARSEKEKNGYFTKMTKIQAVTPRGKTIDAHQYEYYSDWYNSAIRELAGTAEFKNDPEWIATRLTPSITPSEAKKAIDRLLKLGLLRKNETGKIIQDSPVLSINPDVTTLSIRNFNKSMIEMGMEAIERFPQESREISGATFHISHARFSEMKTLMREFKERLMSIASSDNEPADSVYQFNMQFFPLSRPINPEIALQDNSRRTI